MKATNALIIVDIQNYFINDHTQHLPQKILELTEQRNFDYILFTKFVNNSSSNFYKMLSWTDCEKSPDTDIHPILAHLVTGNNVFEKSTFSIFKSNLADFLIDQNITKLYLCGVDIESCVLSSAFDAFDLGYNVEVLKDFSFSNAGVDLYNSTVEVIKNNLER